MFAGRVAQTSYERHWARAFKDPGFGAHLLAILPFIVPKIGAAADLSIKIPTTDTEERYLRSVNLTVDEFRGELDQLTANGEPVALPNVDLDIRQGWAIILYGQNLRAIARAPHVSAKTSHSRSP
jgi:hypothetical protein